MLVAIIQARSYFSQHPERVRQWYLDDSQLGYTLESIISAASIDPNLGVESPANIDLSLSESDIATLEQGASWRQEQVQSGVGTPILTAIDQEMLAQAIEKVTTSELENIEVIMPSAREARWGGEKSNYLLDLFPHWAFFIGMVLLTLISIEFLHDLA